MRPAGTYEWVMGLRFRFGGAGCRRKTRWRPPEGPRSWRQKFPHEHGFQIHGGVVKRIGDLTLRIVIVGSRILPFRHAGDKNFWLDMFGGLQRLGHDLEIVSAMVEDVPNGGLPLRRVAPIPVYLRPDLRFNPTHWYIAGTNNYVSK